MRPTRIINSTLRRALAAFALASLLALTVKTPAQASGLSYNPDNVAREFLWQEFTELPKAKRPKVGVALSGGGAKGFAHVGVLETLTNAGFPIDCLAGTSMGAVVGSMFAAGLPFENIWQIGKTASFSKVSRDYNAFGVLKLMLTQQLFSSDEMENFVTSYMGEKTFEQLKIPFACTAMDIKTGENIVFHEGPVAVAVHSSMNIPGIFSPVEYRQRYLVDGGVANFLPIDPVRALGADWVLSSVTLSDYSTTRFNSVLAYVMQVVDIRGALLTEKAIKESNFVVEPQIDDISFIELNRCSEAGERGTVAMNGKIDAAKESLILFALNDITAKYK